MDTPKKPSYPLKAQLATLGVAALIVGGGFLTKWADAELYLVVPRFRIDIPLRLLSCLVAVLVVLAPLCVHRRRLKRLREGMKVCCRCESLLREGEQIAIYGQEFICEKCTAAMEEMDGAKLPRVKQRTE